MQGNMKWCRSRVTAVIKVTGYPQTINEPPGEIGPRNISVSDGVVRRASGVRSSKDRFVPSAPTGWGFPAREAAMGVGRGSSTATQRTDFSHRLRRDVFATAKGGRAGRTWWPGSLSDAAIERLGIWRGEFLRWQCTASMRASRFQLAVRRTLSRPGFASHCFTTAAKVPTRLHGLSCRRARQRRPV